MRRPAHARRTVRALGPYPLLAALVTALISISRPANAAMLRQGAALASPPTAKENSSDGDDAIREAFRHAVPTAMPPVPEAVHKSHKKVVEESHKLKAKIKELDELPDNAWDRAEHIQINFMPGFKFQFNIFAGAMSQCVLCVLWFSFYFGLVYTNDRDESKFKHFRERLRDIPAQLPKRPGHTAPSDTPAPSVGPPLRHDVCADIIFHFHHPLHNDGGMKHRELYADTLHSVIIPQHDSPKHFPRLYTAMNTSRSTSTAVKDSLRRGTKAIQKKLQHDVEVGKEAVARAGDVASTGSAHLLNKFRRQGSHRHTMMGHSPRLSGQSSPSATPSVTPPPLSPTPSEAGDEMAQGLNAEMLQTRNVVPKLDISKVGSGFVEPGYAENSMASMAMASACLGSELSETGQVGSTTPMATSRFSDEDQERATSKELCTDGLTYSTARECILQDMCSFLQGKGFNVMIFSSIDNDELFLCVGLVEEEVAEHYAVRNHLHLQVQPEIIVKIGIVQPPLAASAPHIPYTPMLAQTLQNVLPPGQVESDLDVFQVHDMAGEACILGQLDRIRIIYEEVNSHINLEAASNEGLILSWYPMHDPHRLALLNATWANFTLLKDLTFQQPLTFIRNYFGGRVAFMFAWQGVYCKALLALVSIAIAWLVTVMITKTFIGPDVLRRRQVMGFSIVLILWSRVVCNLWAREEAYFNELWDMEEQRRVHERARPEYVGDLCPSEIDGRRMHKLYPPHLAFLRKALSWGITLGFCGLVTIAINAWRVLFEGRMNISASIVLTIIIKVFEFVYSFVAPKLTDYENHKYDNTYFDSYMWKQVLFQFVNNFSAFFFLTIANANLETACPDNDCLSILRYQLSVTLAILGLCGIAQAAVSGLYVWAALRWEVYQIEKTGKKADPRFFSEAQAKFLPYGYKEQIDAMLQLVLGLGHVLLFGAVAPIVVPFCFFAFSVQLRVSAFTLTHSFQRVYPRPSLGIADWRSVVRMLRQLGVLYSGFLVVSYGSTFQGTNLLCKLTGFLLFTIGMLGLWELVDLAVPPEDKELYLLRNRRAHVQDRLMQCQGDGLKRVQGELKRQGISPTTVSVGDGEWDKIQKLSEIHGAAHDDLDTTKWHNTDIRRAVTSLTL